MVLTRIKTDNILDQQVFENDLADGAVTFNKLAGISGGLAGHVLKTDGFGGLFWEVATGTSTALSTLVDVDVTTVPPLNGDSLVYNDNTLKWEPGSNVSSSLSLNSLIDVTISPLTQNEFLRYDGVGWINDTVSVIYVEGIQPVAVTGLLDALVDVTATGAIVNQTLVFNGAKWVASTLSVGVGTASNTFMVADITARDLLTPADGDQSFVRSGATSSEWEMYIWDVLALPGPTAAWVLTATEDSASTDANTIEAIVVPATISPVLLGNVSPNSRVTVITIDVTAVFDGTPTLTVGDSGDNARLIDDTLHDLSEVGTYTTTTDYIYGGSADTDINGYFSAGGATVGSARILVTYV